jgi:DNA-binding MarR family transcriptional regulator
MALDSAVVAWEKVSDMAGNRYTAAARFRAELRRFLRDSETCARQEGLTPQQYLVLLQIGGSQNGTATVSELVDRLALTQSTVTELVQRAEHAGLVSRRPAPHDARVVLLRLTGDGERRLARVHRRLGAERSRLRAVMDALE